MSEVCKYDEEPVTNNHHGVPRSFLGSNNRETNITPVEVNEHFRFHDMAGYKPPAEFLRTSTLSSASWESANGKVLPPTLYRDLLSLLTPDDWRSVYYPSAVYSEEEASSYVKANAAVHISAHLCEEIRLTSQAIFSLRVGNPLPLDVRNFTNGAVQFFHAKNPTCMMRSYLNDYNASAELKWAKPLLPSVRSALCDMLKSSRFEIMTTRTRADILQVLCEHQERLIECATTWSPHLRDHIDEIAEYGQKRAEKNRAKHADIIPPKTSHRSPRRSPRANGR